MSLNAGKTRRVGRLLDREGHTVILPLDIVVPVGPVDGAADTGALLDMAGMVGVDAVLLRWGEAKRYADRIHRDTGLIVRLSGSTALYDGVRWPALINSVEASLSIGAEAVCMDVEIGGTHEGESLRCLAEVCEEAEHLGVAVLAEVHIGDQPSGLDSIVRRPEALAWGARTAQECGADLVKIAYPGSAEAMRVICGLAQIPVVVAGGVHREPHDVLYEAEAAIRGGASGTAIGRNVIGHRSPADMQLAVIELVRGNGNLNDICARLDDASRVAS